ncbi:MAG: hypothetical protein HZA22_05605 [Nitrospirae bacterium]|nr:hypothetical protein [Nitrospirota bacterium]MBI5695708.1 hypothetical protein [Nitrospirota bacterium]
MGIRPVKGREEPALKPTGALRSSERGQTLIEYVLILVLIALVVVLVLRGL